MIKNVFFDLDGTLFDTAPEFLIALNTLRARHHKKAIPLGSLRPWISDGAQGMLKHGFDLTPDDHDYSEICTEFLQLYSNGLGKKTVLFDGFQEILNTWKGKGFKWGIVTNKAAWLTEPLLKNMGFWDQADVVVSGDTVDRLKPAPDSLLYACAHLNVLASESLYVGDAARDMEAGRAAGMKTIAALYGYIPPQENPNYWPADGHILHPSELTKYL